SSTTVRRRATVLRRPQGDRLLQNNSEYSTAIKPVSSRMMPRVWTLMPGVVASTAKARMAPSTIRKMPTPMLIFHRPSRYRWGRLPACRACATLQDPKPVGGVTDEPSVLCWQGSLLLCHGLGRHDLSCAPGGAEPATASVSGTIGRVK